MIKRILSGGALAALAGAAMLVATATPSAAFTLSSPSLEAPVASADIDHVWWDRWGRWHPNCWINAWGARVCRGGPGYGVVAPGIVVGPGVVRWGWWGGRRCWWDRWGYRHCRW